MSSYLLVSDFTQKEYSKIYSPQCGLNHKLEIKGDKFQIYPEGLSQFA